MICREFEDRWNQVLDARSDGWPDLDRPLQLHLTTCERCQAVSAQYQLLRQAVSAWGSLPMPTASAESVERLRRLTIEPRRRGVTRRMARLAVSLTAAAAVLVAIFWTTGPGRTIPTTPRIDPTPTIARTIPSRPIESTLQAATSATIDLALEASAPAARIGRDVLTFEPSENPAKTSSDEPDLALTVASVSATDVFQSVGERVKPLSGSARRAFSFLLGPASGTDGSSSTPRGATQ